MAGGGPAGKIVGRVNIRVAPDTSRFRQELEDDLQRMKNLEVEIDVVPDLDGFSERIKAAVEKAEATNKVDIPVDVDQNRLQQAANAASNVFKDSIDSKVVEKQVDKVVQEVTRVDNQAKQVTQTLVDWDSKLRDVANVSEKVDDRFQRIHKSTGDTVEDLDQLVKSTKLDKIDLDTTLARKQIQTLLAQLEAIERGDYDPAIDLKIQKAQAKLNTLTAQLENLDDNRAFKERSIDLDIAKATAKSDQLIKKFNELDKAREFKERSIDLDIAKAKANIEIVTARLERLGNASFSPEVEVQTTRAAMQLATLGRQLETLEQKKTALDVEFNGETIGAQIATVGRQLEELDGKKAQLAADFDDGAIKLQIQQVELELAKLNDAKANPSADLDTTRINAQIAALQVRLARLAAERHKITVELDVDRSALDRVMDSLQQLGERVLSPLSQGMNGLGRGAGRAAQTVLRLVGFLAAAVAIAPLLAVAGAAITAAWGAVSVVIAAIPGLLLTLLGPITAIALGMDGIKAAARSLQPEFDNLKKSVSDTFERGLTPVFERLAVVFPTLTRGLSFTATALTQVASEIADVIVAANNADQIAVIFDNINLAIAGMAPGLQAIVQGIILVGQQRGAFDILTTAVNTFGAAFQASVLDLIGNGVLETAFAGLNRSVQSLTLGFVALVENGITVFANAAPGVNAFLDSLTAFFNRFDWASLGASVGGVFLGLSEALNSVPDGAFDAIEQGFADLAAAFQNPEFAAAVRTIIEVWIPGIIQAFTTLVNALPGFVSSVTNALRGIAEAWNAVDAVFGGRSQIDIEKWFPSQAEVDAAIEPMGTIKAKLEASLDGALGPLNAFPEQINTAFTQPLAGLPATVNTSMQEIAQGIVTGIMPTLDGLPPEVQAGVTAIADALDPIDGTGRIPPQYLALAQLIDDSLNSGLTDAEANAANSVQAMVDALKPPPGVTAEEWKVVTDGIKTSLETGTAGAAESAKVGADGITKSLQPAEGKAETTSFWGDVWDSMQLLIGTKGSEAARAAATASEGISTATTDGLGSIPGDAEGALSPLPGAVQNPFDQASQLATTSLAQLGANVAGAMAILTGVIQGGFPAIQTAFTSGWDQVSTSMNSSFTNIQNGAVIGMASIAAVVAASFPEIGAAFTAGWTTIGTEAGAAFTQIAVQVQTGMTLMGVTVAAGFAEVLASFTAGFANLDVAVATGFTQLGVAAATGMQGIALQVTASFPAVTAAFTAAFATLQPVVTAAFTNLGLAAQVGMQSMAVAVTAGMAAITAAVTVGMAAVRASLTIGWAAATAAAIAAMAQMVAAVVAGMAQMTAAVLNGVAQMQAAWLAGWAQMQAATLAAVAAMTAAIQAGMAQAVAVVQASIAQMVGALNAAVGQFRAAGANMGAALAQGLRSQQGAVQAAAAALANAAAAATRAAAAIRSPSRVFTVIGGYMGAGIAVGLDRSVSQIRTAATRVVDVIGDMVSAVSTEMSPLHDEFGDISANVPAIRSVTAVSYTDTIDSEDYGMDYDRLADAVASRPVELDGKVISTSVNKNNTRKARRG